jgi:competence transcription factor ComK
MKKLIILFSTVFFFAGKINAQQSEAIELAQRIAQKMKDTLDLTEAQHSRIFQINIQLHTSKQNLRQQIVNTDTLRVRFQQVERSRDSLYRTVLPDEKYKLYLQKKRTLVSSN